MTALFSLVFPPSANGLAAVTLDGIVVWGLLIFAIGLIGWSKYNEPPIADPYATPRLPQASGVQDRAGVDPESSGDASYRTSD